MLEATCHCGALSLRIAAGIEGVTECNCSICRRLGVLWAYLPPAAVTVTGATQTYAWGARSQAFHRCPTCGCVSHWAKFDPGFDRLGVNARLLPPDVLARARVHHLDGAVTDEYLD